MGGGKLTDLFGIWQTIPITYEPNILPKNKYGNFEVI